MAEDVDNDDDTRLQRLETQGVKNEGRLSHVENTLVHHGTKLDQIITSVSQFSGRPIFDAHKMISTVRDLFAIGAVIATLSVWLVLTLTAANDRAAELVLKHQGEIADLKISVLQSRIDRISNALNWKATMEKLP